MGICHRWVSMSNGAVLETFTLMPPQSYHTLRAYSAYVHPYGSLNGLSGIQRTDFLTMIHTNSRTREVFSTSGNLTTGVTTQLFLGPTIFGTRTLPNTPGHHLAVAISVRRMTRT